MSRNEMLFIIVRCMPSKNANLKKAFDEISIEHSRRERAAEGGRERNIVIKMTKQKRKRFQRRS